jgi:hypothetical protein
MPTNVKPPSPPSTSLSNRIWLVAMVIGVILISWSYFGQKSSEMVAPLPSPSGTAPAQTPAP